MTLRGTNTVQLNGVEIEFSNTGKKVKFHYDGEQDEVAALVSTLREQGYTVTYRYDKSPLASIDATFPDSEAPGRTGDITDTNNSTGVFTAPAHELLSGDGITVSGIVGITGSVTYYVQPLDLNTFKLYSDFNLATQVYPTDNNDTGTFTKVESPLPRWELFAEEIVIPICDAFYIPKLGGSQLSDAQKAVFKKIIGGEKITQTEANLFASPAEHLALYDAVTKDGLRSVAVDRPVITCSRTATKGFSNAFMMSNVGKILTTAQMTSLEKMESGLLDGYVEFPAAPRTIVGWKKWFPKREALGGGVFAISQKYEYGWWQSSVFTAAS